MQWRIRVVIAALAIGCTSGTAPAPATVSAPGSAPPGSSTPRSATPPTSAAPASAPGSPAASLPAPTLDDLGIEAFAAVSPFVRTFMDEPGPDEAQPLSATITYAEDAATVAVVPRSGGSLTATGPDGTSYSLSIPGTALVTDTELSMTPIVGVATPAAGGPVAWELAIGVRVEPSGLYFLDAAQLEITPAEAIDDARAVASSDDGVGLHPYPLMPGGGIVLPIVHLSEFIVTDGIYLPVEVPSSIPAGAQAQLERDIVASHEDGGVTAEAARAVRDKYWPYVEAILGRSATDCAFAESGQLARAGGFMHVLAVVGFDAEGDVAAFQGGLLVAIENCIRELTEERCFDPNNPSHVTRLIGLVRQAQLAGGPEAGYEIVSAALAGKAPGTALCGDVVGLITWGNVTRGDGGSDSIVIVDTEGGVIEVNLDRGPDGFVDRGSRFAYTYRNTFTTTGENPCTGTITSTGEGRGAIVDRGGIIALDLVESTVTPYLYATGTGAGHTSVPDPACGRSGPHERTFGASCPGTGAAHGIGGVISQDGGLVTIACKETTTYAPGIFDQAFASGHLTTLDRSARVP